MQNQQSLFHFWYICFPSKYEKKFFTRIPFQPLVLSVDLTIEPCHQNCDFRFSPKYVFPFENMNFLQKYVFLNKICISFKNIIFHNMYFPSVSLLQNMQSLTAWIWNLIDSSGVMFLKFVLRSKLQMKTKTYWWGVV